MSLGDLIGDSFVSMNDITRSLGKVAPSEEATTKICELGVRALDKADGLANQVAQTNVGMFNWMFGGVDASSPGEQKKRDEARAHLTYYQANPAELANGFYDARDWAQRAFVLYNASVQSNQDAKRIAGQFWSDVLAELEALPGKIGQTVGDVAGSAAAWSIGKILMGFISTPFGMVALLGAGYMTYRYVRPYARAVRRLR